MSKKKITPPPEPEHEPAAEKPKKPHVSPAQLDLSTKCGEAYRRRYLENEKIPPGIAALQGTGVHGGAEANFRQKLETHQDLPASQIVEAAVASFEAEQARGGVALSEEEAARGATIVLGEAKDMVARMASFHAEVQAPDYQPALLEERIRIVLPEATHDIVGVLDLLDSQHRVADFKTAAKRKNQAEVDQSVALTSYSAFAKIATGKAATEVRLDVIVKNKKLARQIITSDRSGPDYRVLANRTNALLAALKSGVFVPAYPGAWWCSPRWCGYWSTCPYVNAERKAKAEASEE